MSTSVKQIYGVDSNVIVWAMRDQSRSKRPDMEKRCKALLEQFSASRADVCLSAISAAELLVPLDKSKHALFLSELQRQFQIVPFDNAGASIVVELEQLRSKMVKSGTGDRKIFSVDRLIIASLRAAGVTVFYSDDERCRKLAKHLGMTSLEIPFDEKLDFNR